MMNWLCVEGPDILTYIDSSVFVVHLRILNDFCSTKAMIHRKNLRFALKSRFFEALLAWKDA